MPLKKRLLFYELNKHVHHKNALVITGLRQVGKSTLMRQLYDEAPASGRLWFDFDNPLDQKLFEMGDYNAIYKMFISRLVGFQRDQRVFVFIDEIQNFPVVTRIIKYLIDHYGVKFIVTGSSSYYLKHLFPESLAGRKFLYELSPMRFGEYLYFQGKITLKGALGRQLTNALRPSNLILLAAWEFDYKQFLKFGGFPEVVLTEDEVTKQLVLKNILSSFFEKDIRLLGDYKDIRELRDLLLLLAVRAGQLLDVTKLASELSVRRTKIYEYLEFLQGVFMIHLLSKFSRSIDRSVAGGRKVYFADTGLLNTLGQVNEGQIFENAVHNQLSRYGGLSFYRKGQAEIDFILDKRVAFEAKLTASRQDTTRLDKIAGKLRLPDSYVISKNILSNGQFVSPLLL